MVRQYKLYKITDRTGKKFLYNDDNALQLCLAWHRAANYANYIEDATQVGSVNIYSLKSDWRYNARKNVQDYSGQYNAVEHILMTEGGEAAIRKLTNIRIQTKKYLNAYFENLQAVNDKNASALRHLENLVTRAKFVRDFGATLVVVGTSVVSMPTATAALLLTGGAGAKAYGKYTDSGNVGAAAVEFVCEMGVGLVGVGAKAAGAAMTAGEKVCVVLFAKMPAEGAKSLSSGDTLAQAAAATLTCGILSFASEGLTKLLENGAVPAAVEEATKSQSLKEALGGIIRGMVENKIEDVAKDKAKSTISCQGRSKNLNFKALQNSHINKTKGVDEEAFVRNYCLTPI